MSASSVGGSAGCWRKAEGVATAPKAELFGVEAEAVKYFDLFDLGGEFFANRRLVVSANYTWNKSN